MNKSIFIAFEGIDGCGKSTQIKKFVGYLFDLYKHNHIVLTRNPYKNSNIRTILKEDDNPLTHAEKLADLFITDRFQHVKEVVKPNLENGNIVVTDRFKLSTIAYQGAQGIPTEDLIKRHEGLLVPDITFIIDLPASKAVERMKIDDKREKRNEHKFEASVEFLEKTRDNYLKSKGLLTNERIFIINGDQEAEEIHKEIISIFERELNNTN